MQSEQIGELAAALAAAQATIKAPTKGRTAQIKSDKGSYGYKYADLADVIDCYREPLSKHDLALTQTLRVDEGHMVLRTTLLHKSGQWIASEYPLANYNRPQEQGSAITYARRYSVTSLLGIAAEDDDDGQAAQHAEPVRREEPKAAPFNADASAIMDLAVEIEQLTGKSQEQIVKDASWFEKDGKEFSFDDPRKAIHRPKWLASTRKRLESELTKHQAIHEPGVKEAAELFDAGPLVVK